MDHSFPWLFSDWDLAEIVANMDADREEEVSPAIRSIQEGNLDEAERWLAAMISRYPWALMAAAHVFEQSGNPDQSKRYLRAVTLISHEPLVQSWAWHNLRRLGYQPTPNQARQVLGLIVEVPYQGQVDVLATFSDGTARYYPHTGGAIIQDDYDEEITPQVLDALRRVEPVGEAEPRHAPRPPLEGEVRMTVLTPAGMHIWQGAPEETSPYSRVLAMQAGLLRALVQKALNRQNLSAPTD